MSARHMKWAREQRDQSEEKEDQEEEEHASPAQPRRSGNVFDLLGHDDDDDQSDDYGHPQSAPDHAQKSQEKKGGVKKRRPKKKKGTAAGAQSVERVLAELGIKDQAASAGVVPVAATAGEAEDEVPAEMRDEENEIRFFPVDPKMLDPEAEMHALFRTPTAGAARRRAAGSLKHTLVRPRDTWPPVPPGSVPSMVLVTEGEQEAEFSFGGDPAAGSRSERAWREAYGQFEEAARTHDPQTLVDVLRDWPYQPDTLIQLALLHAQFNEEDSAEDLLGRCLFGLQASFDDKFSIVPRDGKVSRVKFGNPANRSLFLALFRYVVALNKRGCVRTALEFAKLTINLDPTDPMGTIFLLDHLAVRSGELRFAILLSRKTLQQRPLSSLPNVLFSAALAKHLLEGRKNPAPDRFIDSLPGGDNMLQYAVSIFPGAASALLDKVLSSRQKAEGGDALIRQISGWAESLNVPEALSHLCRIFAERNGDLWMSEQELVSWLQKICRQVMAERSGPDAADMRAVRRTIWAEYRAGGALVGVYRHLMLSDFASTVARIPPEALARAFQEEGHGYVPFDIAEAPVHAPTSNLLRLFIYTLLPWVPVPNAPPRN